MKTRELIFEKEIDVENTIKRLVERGYAIKLGYRYIVFDKEKSLEEVKERYRKETTLGRRFRQLLTIGSFLMGLGLGTLLNRTYIWVGFIGVLFILVLFAVKGKYLRWVSFNNRRIFLYGDFDEEDIKIIEELILFKG